MKPALLALLSAGLLLTQCGKKHDPSPLEQLPPATQTGANTFGCLLNGQAWTPNGNSGYGTGNYSVAYDPTFNGGELTIGALRYTIQGRADTQQGITIYISDFQGVVGTYSLGIPRQQDASFYDKHTRCYLFIGDPYYRRGTLTLTRFDRQAHIASGTFEFTLYDPGCDSVKVTQGRFDKKF